MALSSRSSHYWDLRNSIITQTLFAYVQLSANARIQLRGSYFNERLDVIEPLLEPVEKADFTYRLWQLNIEVI